MVKSIIINSSNYVQNSGNKFVYQFPNTVRFQAGTGIGVAGIAVYNSLQNITVARGNNTLVLSWLGVTYNLTIPPGYYSVSDLNFYLQNQCILNGLYCTSNNGASNVYFIELAINSVRYATSLNFYAIPTASQAAALGYSQAPNATWSYPQYTALCPFLTFNQNFGNLVGMTFGTYPQFVSASNVQYLSTQTPVISPVDSLIFCCNLVNSKYSIPNNILYTIPIASSLGSIIQFNPSSIVYNNVIAQTFSTLEITVYSQLFEKVELLDKEMTLSLVICEPNDIK